MQTLDVVNVFSGLRASHPPNLSAVFPSGGAFCHFRHYKPVVVAVLVLAEPANLAVLVEVWYGGAFTARSRPAGAAGFPSTPLGSGRSCCLASQHRTCPFSLLQVQLA